MSNWRWRLKSLPDFRWRRSRAHSSSHRTRCSAAFRARSSGPPGDGGWLTYITVDDVDTRVEKAKAAGATIIDEAMTAPGVGRMATIADPFGARLAFIDYSRA